MPSTSDAKQPPSLRGLFAGFFGIGMMGFGGVLPWARRMVVEQRAWLTGAEFTELLALCQFLPGPNIVNMSVALGARFHGVRGSLAAMAGLLAAPVTAVIALGVVFEWFGADPVVSRAFAGLAASASGLVVAMAVKIAWPIRSHRVGIAVAATGFAAIAAARLPLLPTMAVLAPVSILLCLRYPAQ